MKLSTTQIVLGCFLLLAACYIVGWMIFGVSYLLNIPVPDESGMMRNTDVFPRYEVIFTIARYASGLLLGLGLVVLLTGAFRKRAESRKKVAITQITTGALITAVSVFVARWGYSIEFIVPVMPEGSHLLQSVNINPGLAMVLAAYLTVLTALLGLAVLGVGIAQYIRARK